MGGKAILLLVISFSTMLSVVNFNSNSSATVAVENMSSYYSNTNVHNIATSVINMAANELFKNKNWSGYSNDTIYLQGGYATLDVSKISSDIVQLTSNAYYDFFYNGEKTTKNTMVRVLLKASKFSKFAYYSQVEGNIWWTDRDTVWGPLHTQDYLRAYRHPTFHGKVSMKKNVKYYTSKSMDKPVFKGGYETGVDLPRPTTVLSDLMTEANSNGFVFDGPSNVYLTFKNDSISYKFTSTGTETTVLASDFAPNGVIYAKNANIRLKGSVNGAYTLVSEKRVYLDDNIVYQTDPRSDPTSDDILGIIANNEIFVTDNTPNRNDIKIHASLYSINEGFGAENYSTRPPSGTIDLLGGIIQYQREAVGTFNYSGISSGFNKRYRYDDRFMKIAPPAYPGTGIFEILSWYE